MFTGIVLIVFDCWPKKSIVGFRLSTFDFRLFWDNFWWFLTYQVHCLLSTFDFLLSTIKHGIKSWWNHGYIVGILDFSPSQSPIKPWPHPYHLLHFSRIFARTTTSSVRSDVIWQKFCHDGLTVSFAIISPFCLLNMLLLCALCRNRQNRQTVILLFCICRAPVW